MNFTMNKELREEAKKLGFPFDEFDILEGDDISKLKNLCGKSFVASALALLASEENPIDKVISAWILFKKRQDKTTSS